MSKCPTFGNLWNTVNLNYQPQLNNTKLRHTKKKTLKENKLKKIVYTKEMCTQKQIKRTS